MANLNIMNSNRRGKKNKPMRHNLKVDFTPMVDMNMLLITFFMFCTTLSIPQVMDIAVPTKEPPAKISEQMLIPESKTITLILGENDKVYYYNGLPDYKNYASLKETDYNGLREVLLERNAATLSQIKNLKQQLKQKELSESDFKQKVSEAKKSKDAIIAVLKPTADSNYKNLVDALDEMQICSVGRYALIDMTDGDKFLVDNYKSKGTLVANADQMK